MAQIGYLNAKFDADVANFIRDMGRAANATEDTAKVITGAVQGANSALAALRGSLTTGISAGAVLATGAALIKLGDEYSILQTRIKGVSESTKEYKQLSEAIYTTSQKNGVGLESTAKAFQQIAQNAKSFGATNSDVLKLTNAVQQLGVISGTSGESMKAAMLQFSQAMGSGTLAGDELKSIMENMPALADRIAAGLGVTRGELKKMGSDGKLTSDLVFGAILKQTEEINQQFEKMPTTLEQGMTSVQNSILKTVGEFDQMFGVSRNVAGLLKSFSGFIDSTWKSTKGWFEETHKVELAYGKMVSNLQLLKASANFLWQTTQKWFAAMGGDENAQNLLNSQAAQMNAFRKAINDVIEADKQLEVQQQKREQKVKAKDAGAAFGLPSSKEFQAYLDQQRSILQTFDLDKVFAAKADDIAADQVASMSKFTNMLLETTKEKIAELEKFKDSLGDSKADKVAKKAIDDQIHQYKELKKELDEQNKALDKQWELVEKIAEATKKQAKEWAAEEQKKLLIQQAEATAALNQVQAIEREITLLKAKNSHDAEQIALLEAKNKLAQYQNLTAGQYELRLNQLVEAQKKLNEAVAEGNTEKQIQQMKEANELLAARVQGTEDEYLAQKKLRDLLKDVHDPAKIAQYTKEIKEQLSAEKALKEQLETQKKTLDAIKNSTAGYAQKIKDLGKAFADGKINTKQYTETLEELRKKQVETFQKGVKDWTDKLFDGLAKSVTEGKKLKDVFKDLGKELGLLAAKKLLFEPLSNAISNWAGKLYGGSIFGAPGSSAGTAASAPGGGGILGKIAGLFGGGSSMPPLAPALASGSPASVSGGSSGGLLGGQMSGPMSMLGGAAPGGGDKLGVIMENVISIRNMLALVRIGTSAGEAIRVWDGQWNQIEKKPDWKSSKTPFKSSNSGSGSGGTTIDLGQLVPLISSLIGNTSDGPAWRVVMPDCPCPGGMMAGGFPASIMGGAGGFNMPMIMGSPQAPAALPQTLAMQAEQAARAAGTYQNPTAPVAASGTALGWGSPNTYLSTQQTNQYLQGLSAQNSAQMQASFNAGNTSYAQLLNYQGAWKNALNTQAFQGYRATPAWLEGMNGGNFNFGGGGGISTQMNIEPEGTFTPGLSGAVSGKPLFAPVGSGGTKSYTWSDWEPDPVTGATAVLRSYALGGNPMLNRPALIGERGPELFVPRQNGVILPNDRLKEVMGGGAAPVINLHDYTSTASAVDNVSRGPDGAWNIALKDAVANMASDPRVKKAVNSRPVRRGN